MSRDTSHQCLIRPSFLFPCLRVEGVALGGALQTDVSNINLSVVEASQMPRPFAPVSLSVFSRSLEKTLKVSPVSTLWCSSIHLSLYLPRSSFSFHSALQGGLCKARWLGNVPIPLELSNRYIEGPVTHARGERQAEIRAVFVMLKLAGKIFCTGKNNPNTDPNGTKRGNCAWGLSASSGDWT